MMLKAFRIASLAAAALLLPLALFGAEPQYDARTEVTLNGTATYVADHPSRASWTGLYTILRIPGGEIEVHLAPSSFLLDAGIELKAGDSVRVVGSKVSWKGADIILAREITVKETTVQLREKSGTPRW